MAYGISKANKLCIKIFSFLLIVICSCNGNSDNKYKKGIYLSNADEMILVDSLSNVYKSYNFSSFDTLAINGIKYHTLNPYQ